ncbi:hypothetical protein VDGL01_04433 [Verticillium dahliae]
MRHALQYRRVLLSYMLYCATEEFSRHGHARMCDSAAACLSPPASHFLPATENGVSACAAPSWAMASRSVPDRKARTRHVRGGVDGFDRSVLCLTPFEPCRSCCVWSGLGFREIACVPRPPQDQPGVDEARLLASSTPAE